MVLVTKEVAAILRYSTTRPVLRLFEAGEIRAWRVTDHGDWRTTSEDLQEYLRKKRGLPSPIQQVHIGPGLPTLTRKAR